MKTLKTICIVAVIALAFSSCKNESTPEVKTIDVEVSKNDTSKELDPNASYAKVEFGIDGMTCEMGCAKSIEKKMAKMEGVKSAKVDFGKRMAMVEYDEAKVTPKSLEEAVAAVGEVYKVKDMKVVETSEEKSTSKKDCKKKDCCKDKKDGKEMASAEGCAKPCCADKKKA